MTSDGIHTLFPPVIPVLADASVDPRILENRVVVFGLVTLYLAEKAWNLYREARKQSFSDHAASDRGRAEKAEAALEEARRLIEVERKEHQAELVAERKACSEERDRIEASCKARVDLHISEVVTLRGIVKTKDDIIKANKDIFDDLTSQVATLTDALGRQTSEMRQVKALTKDNRRQLRAVRDEIAAGSASKGEMPVFRAEEVKVEGQKVEVEVKPEKDAKP